VLLALVVLASLLEGGTIFSGLDSGAAWLEAFRFGWQRNIALRQ
jgi:hypothetical protein